VGAVSATPATAAIAPSANFLIIDFISLSLMTVCTAQPESRAMPHRLGGGRI